MTLVLAIDTALTRAIVALGRLDGTLVDATTWLAGHRHGEELLPRLDALLAANRVELRDIGAVIVGTGPGAFTGLRVGIATAKALAHGLGSPIVGLSTAAALLAAAGGDRHVLLLPAGPSDRVLVRDGLATLLPKGSELPADVADDLVAVDLPLRAPEAALARGEQAVQGFASALVRIGAARLARGDVDDLARLVPDYVTPPRGVTAITGDVGWSRGPR